LVLWWRVVLFQPQLVALDDFPLGELGWFAAAIGVSLAEEGIDRFVADKTFNQALLAIEEYDVAWAFGPLVFKAIKIVRPSP
jgi:hypothetical protein